MINNHLMRIDPEIHKLIQSEEARQISSINLIASENYASRAVLQASASVLTNKYAEGYPGKRYYSGCSFVDAIENLARERCKELFGAEHVNVQPHAGSQANMTVYAALMKPGDTIMGMSLATGGHLTHGHPVNFSGVWYRSVQYGVDRDTELIDYDYIATLAEKERPKVIVAGASAYSRIIDFARIADIASSVDAYFVADIAHIAGLIAAGLHPSPVPYADCVTSTTHKTLRGPRGGLILSKQQHADRVDRAIMPGLQGGPFMHVIAAKAVCFQEALSQDFKTYQQQVIKNTGAMADIFAQLGYRIVAGGTDNHLFVLDLRNKGLTGLEAEHVLSAVGITISRSCIPFDPEKPWITSGIRIGGAAITTRGATMRDVQRIAFIMDEVIRSRTDSLALDKLRREIDAIARSMCAMTSDYAKSAEPCTAAIP